jgi:signal transduction histidine kinase
MRATDFALAVGDVRGLPRERRAGCVRHASEAAAGHGRRPALVRELHAWTLPALERLAADAAAPGAERHELVRRAGVEALGLRDRVEALTRLDEELACRLHDCALQLLEYTATDGFGQELGTEQLAELLVRTADETRAALTDRFVDATDLDAALQAVADEAMALGLPPVTLACRSRRALRAEEVRPIVDAVREALTNVRKHARAEHVVVRVDDADGELRVSVADDGVGAHPSALKGASGLGLVASIAGRLARHGGRSLVQSAPGVGTRVVMTMPVKGAF